MSPSGPGASLMPWAIESTTNCGRQTCGTIFRHAMTLSLSHCMISTFVPLSNKHDSDCNTPECFDCCNSQSMLQGVDTQATIITDDMDTSDLSPFNFRSMALPGLSSVWRWRQTCSINYANHYGTQDELDEQHETISGLLMVILWMNEEYTWGIERYVTGRLVKFIHRYLIRILPIFSHIALNSLCVNADRLPGW